MRHMTPLAHFLAPEGYTSPRYLDLVKELHLSVEVGSLAVRRLGCRGPVTLEGAGSPVVLVPGFLAGDYSLRLLSRTLRAHGYRTYRAAIRTNVRCTNDAALLLERRIERVVERRGERVRIIGHSLGGMLGRGVAVRRPDLVAGVITLGSPMMAPGAAHPVLLQAATMLVRLSRAGLPGLLSEDCVAGECARATWEELHGPLAPDVHLACVWSRWDGLVDPRSCIHPEGLPIEVRASHLGMAISPAVHDRVLAELARQRRETLRRAV